MRRLAILVCGMLIGTLLQWTLADTPTRGAPDTPGEQISPRSDTPGVAFIPPRGVAVDECASRRVDTLRELAALESELTTLRKRHEALVGTPLPWPDETPLEDREALVVPLLADAAGLAEIPGLTWMDVQCEEYPCIAIFEILDDASPPGTRVSNGLTINEAIARAGYPKVHGPGTVWRRKGNGNHIIITALPDRRLSDDEWFHVSERIVDAKVGYDPP